MPRGNLEAVRPRSLVLPAVAAALDAGDFAGGVVGMHCRAGFSASGFSQGLPAARRQRSPGRWTASDSMHARPLCPLLLQAPGSWRQSTAST
jgi:hypothetical protein